MIVLAAMATFSNFGIISVIIKHGNMYTDLKKEIQKLKIEIMEKRFEKEELDEVKLEMREKGREKKEKGFNTLQQCESCRLIYRDNQGAGQTQESATVFLLLHEPDSAEFAQYYALVQAVFGADSKEDFSDWASWFCEHFYPQTRILLRVAFYDFLELQVRDSEIFEQADCAHRNAVRGPEPWSV